MWMSTFLKMYASKTPGGSSSKFGEPGETTFAISSPAFLRASGTRRALEEQLAAAEAALPTALSQSS